MRSTWFSSEVYLASYVETMFRPKPPTSGSLTHRLQSLRRVSASNRLTTGRFLSAVTATDYNTKGMNGHSGTMSELTPASTRCDCSRCLEITKEDWPF
jgi:hypothetical protein